MAAGSSSVLSPGGSGAEPRKRVSGRGLFWTVAVGATLMLTPFRVVEVSGESMMPTLRDGERYLVDRFYYRTGGLRREDVVVLEHGGEQLVKRLVGMPGDRLSMVLGPGDAVFELANLTTGQKGRLPAPPSGPLRRVMLDVPPGHVYVLGDNWWRSDDSRTFGAVPQRSVLGVLRTFSFDRTFPRQEPVRR